jgi:hypothetical protein
MRGKPRALYKYGWNIRRQILSPFGSDRWESLVDKGDIPELRREQGWVVLIGFLILLPCAVTGLIGIYGVALLLYSS